METEQLSRTEKSLYCAQLMQWAILSSHENLQIFCEYYAHVDQIELRIYLNSWKEKAEKIEFYLNELTKEKIAEIQTEIKNILDHANLPE
ncbi:hypothetical protein EBR66_07265 [bacterium]|nr:hypothetical protein [bacterium]